jgi:hypothetical protein
MHSNLTQLKYFNITTWIRLPYNLLPHCMGRRDEGHVSCCFQKQQPGLMVHILDPNTQEARQKDLNFEETFSYNNKTLSQKIPK